MELFCFHNQDEVIAAAIRFMEEKGQYHSQVFESPRDTKTYLQLRIGDREHEVFCVLFLNSKHRLLSADEMFRGTIDGATVHPREIVKRALSLNAAAVILGHNHPSGEVQPSEADKSITKRIKDVLALIDVRVLDHMIVAADDAYSFAEHGFI